MPSNARLLVLRGGVVVPLLQPLRRHPPRALPSQQRHFACFHYSSPSAARRINPTDTAPCTYPHLRVHSRAHEGAGAVPCRGEAQEPPPHTASGFEVEELRWGPSSA